MNILTIAIIVFASIEVLNVMMLYFQPGSKMGNGMGVFNAWEESKQYPQIHSLIKYLINWVAGTKLIFIMLLAVIIITGTLQTQLYAVAALILSILTFFWRLYPIIKKTDKEGYITPKGYSKTLGIMIAVFVMGFLTVFLIALL